MLSRKLINYKEHEENVHKEHKDEDSFVSFAKTFAPFAVKEVSNNINSNIFPS
jgi:hypothetical protein